MMHEYPAHWWDAAIYGFIGGASVVGFVWYFVTLWKLRVKL